MSDIKVISKATHKELDQVSNNTVSLSEASVVKIQSNYQDVKEIVKQGNDVVITLKNGERIVISNFFLNGDENTENSLILEDDQSKLIWIQFTDANSAIIDGVSLFHLESIEPLLYHEASMSPWAWVGIPVAIGGVAVGASGSDKSQVGSKFVDSPSLNPINAKDPIAGTAEPGSKVTVTKPDGITQTVVVGPDGSWSIPNPGLKDGEEVKVTATDPAGNSSPPMPVEVDDEAPSLEISSDDSTLSVGEAVTITFTFSEAVTGFDLAKIAALGGVISNLSTTDNIVWTATFTQSGTAQPSISVADDSYTDLAGNNGSGAILVETNGGFGSDLIPLTLSITDNVPQAVTSGSVTFDKDVVTFDRALITVTGGTAGTLVKVDNRTYTLLVTPLVGSEGTTTDDRTPVLNGRVTGAPLATGEQVAIFNAANNSLLGYATLNPNLTSWTYQLEALETATYQYYAAVVDAAGNKGPSSTNFSIRAELIVTINPLDTLDSTPIINGVVESGIMPGEYLEVTVNSVTYSSLTGEVAVDIANNAWYVQIPDHRILNSGSYDVVAKLKNANGVVVATDNTEDELLIASRADITFIASSAGVDDTNTALTISEDGAWRLLSNSTVFTQDASSSSMLGQFSQTTLISTDRASQATFIDYNRDGRMDILGIDENYGNGQVVSTQILNAQSGVNSQNSTGLVYFYGLDASKSYSAVLLSRDSDFGGVNSVTFGANAPNPIENVNSSWAGLKAVAKNHSYILTAENGAAASNTATAATDATNQVGIAGTGYNDTFFATAGIHVYNGSGGSVLQSGVRNWTDKGGNGVDQANGFHIGIWEASLNADRIDISDLLQGFTGNTNNQAKYINGVATMESGATIDQYLRTVSDGTNTQVQIKYGWRWYSLHHIPDLERCECRLSDFTGKSSACNRLKI